MLRRCLSAAATFLVVSLVPAFVTMIVVGVAMGGRSFTEIVHLNAFFPLAGVVFLFSLLGAYLLGMDVLEGTNSWSSFFSSLGAKADRLRTDAERSAREND